MAGNKNSGRRKWRDEERRHRTIDKCWGIVERQVSDPTIPQHDKVEVACKIVTKDMPSQMEHSGEIGGGGETKIYIVNGAREANGVQGNTQRIPAAISL